MRTPTAITSALFLLTLCACASSDERQISIIDSLPAGTFSRTESGGFEGDLIVRGFAHKEKIQEPFCTDNCRNFTYVYFRVLETGNASLPEFLTQYKDNAYTLPNAIGIGCLEGDVIRSINDSDDRHMREVTIPASVTKTILDSDDDAPVMLHLSKKPLSGGSEAPVCYSHFSNFSIRKG